jgi:hypothetical protein
MAQSNRRDARRTVHLTGKEYQMLDGIRVFLNEPTIT